MEYVVVRPDPDALELFRYEKRDAWYGEQPATGGRFEFHSVKCAVNLDELVRELREL